MRLTTPTVENKKARYLSARAFNRYRRNIDI